MEKLMLYLEIHQLYEKGISKAQIAKELKISRTTVYKYLDMSFEEASEWVNTLPTRKKKLDPYKDWIIAWLSDHPHLSAAQIKDWLLERFPDLKVAESTTRLYVNAIREEYQIDKTRSIRQYEAVEELPMGKQVQVDWGETKQKTKSKRKINLYFISFVLSHSRYKYVEWQDRPFTTRDTIRSHENAFRYFGGMPEEIVYDQDNLIAVNENAGDLILTNEFQAYKTERNFDIYLCRKSDPESKGKIESVVKFVKGNFADSRIYKNIDDWNERCLAWLKRTGNHKVHSGIKKRPDEVFLLEKDHLHPVKYILSKESNCIPSITRNVSKDNTIAYKSNRYSLPLGSYRARGDNTVLLDIKKDLDGRDILNIYAKNGLDILAKHELSLEKGKLIKNNNHSRDHSKSIEAFKRKLLKEFKDKKLAKVYLDKLVERYPRYWRDQLTILEKTIKIYPKFFDQALDRCTNEDILSANDFRNVAMFLETNIQEESFKKEASQLKGKYADIQVESRSLSAYKNILGGISS